MQSHGNCKTIRILESGKFFLWNLESGKFFLWNPKSWALESGIQLNQSVMISKDWNP